MWHFIILFALFPFLNSQCPDVKVCLHGGIFNNKTCACDCYQSYIGETLLPYL